jgi:hypothetical protein
MALDITAKSRLSKKGVQFQQVPTSAFLKAVTLFQAAVTGYKKY